MSQPRHHQPSPSATDEVIEVTVTSLAAGSVEGVPVDRADFPSIHQACVSQLKARSTARGEILLAHAVDTTSGRDEYWIRVFPDGTVNNAAAPDGYKRAEPTPSPSPSRAMPTITPPSQAETFTPPPLAPSPAPDAHQQAAGAPRERAQMPLDLNYSPAPAGFPSAQMPLTDAPVAPRRPPTRADLRAAAPPPPEGPATIGWQATVRRLSGGLISLGPGPKEMEHRRAIRAVQQAWAGPRTVVILNSKGGGIKTTTAYMVSSIFGLLRGGYVLAWDNNESNGNLGSRSAPVHHENTVLELFRDLDQFAHSKSSQVGDLDNYVRAQPARFDVLASKEAGEEVETDFSRSNPMMGFGAEEYRAIHGAMSRYYRLIVVDTGNQVARPNWLAAVESADQLVVAVTAADDIAQGGAGALDHLVNLGYGEAVSKAVTILTHRDENPDRGDLARIRDHFQARTRGVVEIPHSKDLRRGVRYTVPEEHTPSYEAWLRAAAMIADGL